MEATAPEPGANPCPEVADPACRIPLPALALAVGCAPWRPDADWYGRVCVCAVLHGGPVLARGDWPPRGAGCVVQQVSAGGPVCGGGGPPAPALHPPAHGALPRGTRRRDEGLLACRLRVSASLGPAHLPRRDLAEEPVSRPSGLAPECATTTKICAAGASTHAHARASAAPARPPTTLCVRGVGAALSTVHFRGGRVRQVRCNTVLSGCRPLWPPPCCCDTPAPFVCVRSRGTLPAHEVVSSLPALLTSARPLGARCCARARCCACPAASQFGGAPARRAPRHCSTRQTSGAPAVLRDISEGTSYQAVRLVFRRYAQVLPSNCTSERLGASACVSAGFARPRRSSLPIGSHVRSCFCAGVGLRCAA